MTIRNIDQNLVQMIRDLQEEVRLLKSNVGSTRLNSIRLGNWVLEAIDDSLVKMTNIETGEESYIGGVSEETSSGPQYILQEFPPFSIGGMIQVAFNSPIRTNVYIVPYEQEITSVVTTLALTSYTGGTGPSFRIYNNGEVIYTDGPISDNYTTTDFGYTFETDDVVYMEVHNSGAGDSIGLSVMLRR